jgi:hypothetical protein
LCGLDDLQSAAAFVEREGFVSLIPAYSEGEFDRVCAFAIAMAGFGCKEVCCIGPFASELEDKLDDLLEGQGMIGVLTTSFVDEVEGSDYFVFAADGARAKKMVAVVEEHPELIPRLVRVLAQ